MTNPWNERFAEPGYKYGEQPNDWLVTQAPRLSPGSRCLVPGDGEGRNGVWLAGQGHRVLAVDYADVGLAKARALALGRGQEVAARFETRLADLTAWPTPDHPATDTFDAVVLIFVHLPSAVRRAAHRRLAGLLKPGGWLVLEAFHPAQLAHQSGGPRDVDMLYPLDALRADFAPLLSEVEGWEGEVLLNEGPGHQGLGHVTRWVGRSPAPVRD